MRSKRPAKVTKFSKSMAGRWWLGKPLAVMVSNGRGRENSKRERVWFSPHCLEPGVEAGLNRVWGVSYPIAKARGLPFQFSGLRPAEPKPGTEVHWAY